MLTRKWAFFGRENLRNSAFQRGKKLFFYSFKRNSSTPCVSSYIKSHLLTTFFISSLPRTKSRKNPLLFTAEALIIPCQGDMLLFTVWVTVHIKHHLPWSSKTPLSNLLFITQKTVNLHTCGIGDIYLGTQRCTGNYIRSSSLRSSVRSVTQFFGTFLCSASTYLSLLCKY